MERSEQKFVIAIEDTLSAGKAINLASHLSAQLGANVPTLAGAEVVDASGILHGGLPMCPNVILSASAEELERVVAEAREMAAQGEILLLEYPEEGFTTNTDEEFRTAISRVTTEAMAIRGTLIYGLRRRVNAITRGLALWK